MYWSANDVIVPPVGLVGKFSTKTLLLGVSAFSMAAAVTEKASSARQATATGLPCVMEMPGAPEFRVAGQGQALRTRGVLEQARSRATSSGPESFRRITVR